VVLGAVVISQRVGYCRDQSVALVSLFLDPMEGRRADNISSLGSRRRPR
jgi:hypothetical protein